MKRKTLQYILKVITARIIKKYSPLIIAVTGSVGKTSTKEAIYVTLKRYKKIRKSNKNFNTEVGVPLVFFGVDKPGETTKEWLSIIWKGLLLLIKKEKNYPDMIVMEMAADKPGDIEYLTGFIKPNIGVVTAIGEKPVHLEFYKNVNEIVKEKSLLVKHTKKGGTVVLNADDGRVFQMKGRSKTEVKTFGLSKRAEIGGSEVKFVGGKKKPEGIKFFALSDTEKHEVELPHIFDKGSAYSVLAALAVGVSVGIPIYRLVESCSDLKPIKGRMNLVKGDGFWIIDSSYNASPKSMKLALDTLKELPGKRKVAILGDMLELGDFSEKAHKEIGEEVSFLDLLITVGKDSKLISKAGRDKSKLKTFHFETADEAVMKVPELLSKNDLVLVKGSQSIRTEKIIEKIMVGDPKKELIRQEKKWKNNQNEKEVQEEK